MLVGALVQCWLYERVRNIRSLFCHQLALSSSRKNYIAGNTFGNSPTLHSVQPQITFRPTPMQFHFRGQRCRVQVRATKCSSGYSPPQICIQFNRLRLLVILQLIHVAIPTVQWNYTIHCTIPFEEIRMQGCVFFLTSVNIFLNKKKLYSSKDLGRPSASRS